MNELFATFYDWYIATLHFLSATFGVIMGLATPIAVIIALILALLLVGTIIEHIYNWCKRKNKDD